MPTHTDNLNYGTSINNSDLNIDTINQVTGINPESILSYVPVAHDISDQIDGQTKEFNLNPAMAQGTQNVFHVYLDGQYLTRALESGESDYFINSNRGQFELGTDFNTPQPGSTLVVVYVEDTGL